MPVAAPLNGYSAQVRLEVRVGNQRFHLSQIGEAELILKSPSILPGTGGEVCASIDGQEQRWMATWEASTALREIVPVQFRKS